MEIGGHVIQREVIGPGPFDNSQRVRLTGTESAELLVVRSEAEPFPEAVIEEIKQERNAEDLHLPPCRVEIVLGLPSEQRIYVVLPTGVQPSLPFSCNGPFLQDPARLGIKDPVLSPTNRWLLERVGRLAVQSLFAWLDNRQLGIEERARGYALLPSPPRQEDTLDADVTEIVAETFCECAEEGPILLTADADLAIPLVATRFHGNCIGRGIWDNWQRFSAQRTTLSLPQK